MTSPLDLVELERLLAGARFEPEQLPLTNEVRRADGDHFAWSASIFFADHKPGHRPLLSVSLDSRDRGRYDLDTARAALIVAAVNSLPGLIEEVKRLREVVKPFIARHWTDEAPDDPAPHELTDDDVIDITVPFGALRRARAALPAPPVGVPLTDETARLLLPAANQSQSQSEAA